MELVPFINQTLAVFTIAGQVIIAAFIISFFWGRQNITTWGGKNAILLSFIIVLAATLGSLFYSEIAGYEPCKLCWFQRILMYPQTVLIGIALFKKDKGIVDYVIALSVIGALVAGYHYLLQVGVFPEAACDVVGYSVSCAKLFVMQFGYITIPMMSFTAFLLITLFMFVNKRLD